MMCELTDIETAMIVADWKARFVSGRWLWPHQIMDYMWSIADEKSPEHPELFRLALPYLLKERPPVEEVLLQRINQAADLVVMRDGQGVPGCSRPPESIQAVVRNLGSRRRGQGRYPRPPPKE
jgi:hypothetical protein